MAAFAADAVVALHLAFVVFALLGGFLVVRWPWVAILHVPALAWGVWIETSGGICPLTPLENALRTAAGGTAYAGGFVERTLVPLLYPPGLTRETQWVLAAGLVAVNAIAYGWVFARRRAWRKSQAAAAMAVDSTSSR